ncbi:coiled-coil domain-containing protein 57 [Pempheris klunzingeri]|uniref:coiled-coil domain-containing protein 57 n=1 Tax=Pempheris klunzingeri TaxID=3127111 RepID=UPI0039809D32
MQSDGDSGLGDLEVQLANKEREWKELQAARVHQLESSLKKAQEECSTLSERYQQLREDFQFNLAALDERDQELERYDVITARAVTVEHNRQEELNQLRTQVTQLEEQRARESEERQKELHKSRHNAAQLDKLKCSMADETEAYERIKWDLQCRIQELEGELTLQRQEMTAAFDAELRQQEHNFNLKMDEMRAVVLSRDLKVKLLSKETDVHCQAQLQATEALKASKEFCQQILTQLQHTDQETKDLSAVKDYRIKELEHELEWMETKLKEEEDAHFKKYEDVVQALRRGDMQLEAQCQAHTEQLQRAEKHIVKLQENMEALAAQAHHVQGAQQKAMQHKDETIQRLCTEVETTRTGWDKYMSQASSEMVLKDREMIALQERETKLRNERDRSREEMEGYKQQLSAGLKRERALEQMRVQVELEWQRRCEDVKAEYYLANEQLIQDLTQARDQARAELKEKERELQDLTVLLRSVTVERDRAVQGLTPKVDPLASEEICRLQEQNAILRAVVTQMRKDMEGLSHLLPHPQAQPQGSPPTPAQLPETPATNSITTACTQRGTQMATGPPAQSTDVSSKVSPAAPDYTQALEQEVSRLKARCRHLERQLEGAVGPPSLAPATDTPIEDLAPTLPDDTRPQNQRLQKGDLSLEKGANISDLMRPEVREANIMEQQQQQQQQQASGLMSGGLFGNVQGAKSNPAVLRTRLKEAVFFIARLSREKQQLIEMGNRLRAQIITADLKGSGPNLQRSMEPERDPSTQTPEDQHDRLSALEQLQYRLTTQELQYALRQRARTFAKQLFSGTNSLGPANPRSQEHKPTDRPENKENTPPPTGALDMGPQPHSGLSSEESLGSLKELWDILDHGLSPSIFSEGDGELSRRDGADDVGVRMMVHGVSTPIHSQHSAKAQQRRNTSTTPSNTTRSTLPGAPGRIRKIRNYNVKD